LKIRDHIKLFFALTVFWLWIAVLGKIIFFIQNLSFIANSGVFEILQAFYKGILLDLSLSGYLLVPTILISLFVKPTYFKKIQLWYCYIAGALILIINQIDAFLFAEWGTRINYLALVYAQHPAEAMASVSFGMYTLALIVLISAFLILHFSIFFFKKIFPLNLKVVPSQLTSSLVIIPLLGIAFIFIRGSLDKVPVNQSVAYYSNNPLLNQTAVNGPWNLIYYLFNSSNKIDESKLNFMSDEEADVLFKSLHKPSEDLKHDFWFEQNSNPNILFIVMESLSAEAVKSADGALDLCPNFDELTEEGLLFSNMYSSGDRTDKGLVALLSGFPSQPFTSIMTEPAKSKNLPSVLNDFTTSEYASVFLYGGNSAFANMRSYFYTTGFEKVIDQNSLPVQTAKGAWGYHDQDLFASLKMQINATHQPFFFTALTLSSHDPYDFPKEALKNYQDKEPFSKLKASLRYTDSCLGDFMAWFKQQPAYANCLVVIVADHGHPIGVKDNFYFGLHKFKIPCLLTGGALPDSMKGVKITHPVNQHSIGPFLLEKNNKLIRSNYPFYKNPMDTFYPFAWYSFQHGTGWIDENHAFLYYFENEMIEQLNGDETVEIDVQKIKALQHKLLEKYLGY
jgi:phosphoglycerol transferase MdoB-like AlkP superfamily enzyme